MSEQKRLEKRPLKALYLVENEMIFIQNPRRSKKILNFHDDLRWLRGQVRTADKEHLIVAEIFLPNIYVERISAAGHEVVRFSIFVLFQKPSKLTFSMKNLTKKIRYLLPKLRPSCFMFWRVELIRLQIID